MKKVMTIATLGLIYSLNVFASNVLVEVKAKSVESSTKYNTHKEARDCTYAIADGSNDGSNKTLYLNSDEDSGINFSTYVNRVKLPLVQGENASGWNDIKIVRDGNIVTITEKREAAGYGSLYDVLTLDVSADLLKVKSAKYQGFMTNLFGLKKLQEEMNCQF